MDYVVLCYTQLANVTSMQLGNNLYAKSCKVTDNYGKAKLNDICIERVDCTICHSMANI